MKRKKIISWEIKEEARELYELLRGFYKKPVIISPEALHSFEEYETYAMDLAVDSENEELLLDVVNIIEKYHLKDMDEED